MIEGTSPVTAVLEGYAQNNILVTAEFFIKVIFFLKKQTTHPKATSTAKLL